MIALLLALIVTHCPVVAPGPCATVSIIDAHNTIKWHAPIDPWPCDGTVWWVVTLDDADPVTVRCQLRTTPTGDTLAYCPDSIAPVKHWNRAAGQSAWLSIRACNAAGCSADCWTEVVWPAYTCFNGAC